MNFILIAYLIEKLSGLPYSIYLEKYILSPLQLNNTYMDNWDGQFGVNYNRVDEYLLYKKIDNPLNNLGIGICRPYMNLGMMGGAGGIVSNNIDMHKWYTFLFNKSNNIQYPIFKTKESRESILYPYTKINNNGLYYTQGLTVIYDNSSSNSFDWPLEILYSGGTMCSTTAIRMISNDTTQLVITSFSNSPHVYIRPQYDLNDLKYNIDKSICKMGLDKLEYRNLSSVYFVIDNGGANDIADEMIKIWS